MKNRTKFTALITLLFLVLQMAVPLSAHAALDMRTGIQTHIIIGFIPFIIIRKSTEYII